MKKDIIIESKENTYSIKNRGIPKGCKFCLKGAKAVLFLNGICENPRHCFWYCPISEERKNKNITFADEIEINSKEELLSEIDKIDAKGMSITGGEPLFKENLQKTLEFIRFIKYKKGKKFHIHLYTNGINFTESIAISLASAGLDEIRFHPPLEKWNNIKLALNRGMSVGVEVPVIPDNEYLLNLEKLILLLDNIGVQFINLNEFEFCFPNSESLKQRGFKLKWGSIASVENSKENALELMKKMANKVKIKIHFCSIRAKDYFQLKNRYLRRAKNVKQPYEVITDEGLLLYGEIKGHEDRLKVLYDYIINELKYNEKFVFLKERKMKLHYDIALMDEIIKILDEKDLKGHIIEALPFIEKKYRQITEKTPIKVFLQELKENEN